MAPLRAYVPFSRHFFIFSFFGKGNSFRKVICANLTKQDLEFRKNSKKNVVRCFPIPFSFSFLNPMTSLPFPNIYSRDFASPFQIQVREGQNTLVKCAPLIFPFKCEQFDVLHLDYIFGLFGGLLDDLRQDVQIFASCYT